MRILEATQGGIPITGASRNASRRQTSHNTEDPQMDAIRATGIGGDRARIPASVRRWTTHANTLSILLTARPHTHRTAHPTSPRTPNAILPYRNRRTLTATRRKLPRHKTHLIAPV